MKLHAGTMSPLVDSHSVDDNARWIKVGLRLAARILANLQGRSDIQQRSRLHRSVTSSLFEVVVIWTGGNQYTSMCGEACHVTMLNKLCVYRSESPSQIFLIILPWLKSVLQQIPNDQWKDVILSYDNIYAT